MDQCLNLKSPVTVIVFVDLQFGKIYLEIRCKVTQSNGADLRYDNTDPTVSDSPFLVNNSLYSLFSDCTLSANGLKISNANSNFAHKSFIRTEFSNSKGAEDSWLKCQGYRFENNPAERELVRESREIWFYGPAGVDFFTCDKHLLSGVTLRLSYRRSHEDFLIISEDASKHNKLQILEANLYVRKMTVTDHVLSAIESTLLKTPANYPYQEEITKTFLATAGQRSWQQEDNFAREPVRQIIIALNTNNAFLGTNRTNPFHYRKFGLEQVTLRQNGLPIASTPISTQDNKRLFFNTLSALGLLHCGLGITLDNYQQHFIMCFDLTSTQQAAHDFLHPELTNCSVSLDLQFSNALTANLEIFVWGIRSSNVFITSDRKVTKNNLPHFDSLKMDEIQLQDLIQNCKHLKYKFFGVFAADNFPPHIPNNIFMIVNTSKSDSPGTHWIGYATEEMFYTSLILSVFLFGSTPICIND